MKQIVLYPEAILRSKTKKVTQISIRVKEVVAELKETLKKSENGAGLAATQIGYDERILAMKEKNSVKIYINPKIIKNIGPKVYPVIIREKSASAGGYGEIKEEFLEGCLSFPNLYGTVKRYLGVEVEWQELVAKKLVNKKKMMKGFEAIVIQHEIDHLEGILFVDHIRRDRGKLYKIIADKKIVMNIDDFT